MRPLNKKIFFSFVFSVFLIIGFFVFNNFASAQITSNDLGLQQAAATGLPSGDIRTIIARIIKTILGFLGIVALGLVLYAGYLWMTSGGDDEKIGTAKKILINATIGLVIILSAYSIVSFVMNKLVEATTGNVSVALCEKQKANGGPSCGGDCGACSETPCAYNNCSSGKFTIVQTPASGDVCIANVAPVIVFNLDVDVGTLNDGIVIENAATAVPVAGEWSLQSGHNHIAYFKPTKGTCPQPDAGKDCFDANTTYKIKIKNGGKGILSAGGKDLDCIFSTGKCADISFKTGSGVDRQNPTITILYPKLSDSLKQGDDVSVKVHYVDDGGLQNVVLDVDDALVDSQNLSGCQKMGDVTIVWPTNKLPIGEHNLKAIGMDWSANSAEDNSKGVLKPAHCFNGALDASQGEKFVDCGGECGVCAGDKCNKDADCFSGFCFKQNPNDAEGICVEKTYITDFSPASGAHGDYVSIIGKNFGNAKGHVYFSKVSNPNIKEPTDWVEAQVANCGAGFNNWTDNQIIVVVPDNAISGKIAVFSANATGSDNFNIKFYDTTGDGFKKVPNFVLSNVTHPGICGINPNNGSVGKSISISGKNFGGYDPAKSSVKFGDNTKTKIDGWSDNSILSIVPTSLGNGDYGVKVTDGNNQISNSVLFSVSGTNQDAPLISDVSSPANTAIGDYITITGKNFGNQVGSVWFKLNGTPAPDGSFDFPVACKNAIWKDGQIVVKVPAGLDATGKKYTVQVYNSDSGLNSVLDSSKFVTVNPGNPSPGICKITPVSGAVPFTGTNVVTVSGENLGNVSKFYFWKNGGDATKITTTLVGADVSNVTPLSFTTVPNSKDIISGSVFAYRAVDQKQSNSLLFTTNDCIKNGCAAPSDTCCLSGTQAGMCKPKGEICAGQFKTAGFAWMFSTKEIVPPPQVVERCGNDTETGKNLPSPSPSTKWNVAGHSDASKVCQTALVTVEFSSEILGSSINKNSVTINSCDSIDEKGACQNSQPIVLDNNSFVLNTAAVDPSLNNHPYLSIKSQTGKWSANKLYQVVLKNSIVSAVGANNKSIPLVASAPCGGDSAYCFSFKTGEGDCLLKEVVVTPNQFWTKTLESPMRYHTAGGDVYDMFYKGNGLSTQYCTMMDMLSFDWKWSVDNKIANKNFASINGSGNAIKTQVNSLANTVAIGLDKDSVNIKATASSSTISKTGLSALTIDLSNPDVVDYWPNCFEACTNAAVGAKFNVTMSTHNVALNSPAIKLVKCEDENCFSTSLPIAVNSSFDASSGNTILKIANDNGVDILSPDTLYQVTLSATSTPGVDDGSQLWSIAHSDDLADQNNYSKPLNKIVTWRFKTKKEACKIDHISVVPKIFTASKLKDLAVFEAQPYAAPDACSAVGQKLNPWSQNWDWTSSDLSVATIYNPLFKTKGSSAFCTANCTLKGSTVPTGSGVSIYPVCGNGKVEAGEDCDAPDKNAGCGLSCKFIGNLDKTTCGNGVVENNLGEACDPKDPKTKVGCSDLCLKLGSKTTSNANEVNASICGNGTVGSGEDCDLGIGANQTDPKSAMYCSSQCLHLGSRLSSKWCFDHKTDFGGFEPKDYNFYCSQSYSQCGDGITSPDEDLGCEFTDNVATGKHKDWCNDKCLNITKDHPDANCLVGKEGCDDNAQHVGSSLLYSNPSVCGDGLVGIGEDELCESPTYLTNFWHKDSSGNLLTDPWVLVVGQNALSGNSVVNNQNILSSDITAMVTGKSAKGVGKYQVTCGYKTDEECQTAYGGDLNVGVANNSCCYFKSKLTSVYPGNTSTIPANIAQNVCINTFIEADFDSVIDETTLPGNFIIARSASANCTGGLQDVSTSTSFLASFDPNLPWYKNVLNKIIITVKNFFGMEVNANSWCAGADIGSVKVVKNSTGGSKVVFDLNNALAPATDYVVILKKGIKNLQGVSIESTANGKAIGWRFKTGNNICAISGVSVDPSEFYFSLPNVTTTLLAKGLTQNNQMIQPVAGYSWNYQWGPANSPFVQISSTTADSNVITSQNNNGEVDIRASANIIENKYTDVKGLVGTGKSHIIVFLCENPWPPKDAMLSGQTSPTIIFPYEDKVGNNDNFDLKNNIFDNKSIPASSVGKGYFNFSTYYCADNGEHGTQDDLPYLHPAVQANIDDYAFSSTTPAAKSLKRFIFTNDKNSDALGIQIFANPNHLSAKDWFANEKNKGGQGFAGAVQDISIDGYSAVTDGNNIYVNALNFDPTNAAKHGNLYTNVYLFSISENANPETKKVFESILKNLRFNINLTNYGYCGKDIDNPGNETTCTSDLDCPDIGSCIAIQDSVCANNLNIKCTPDTADKVCPPSVSMGQCFNSVCDNDPKKACVEDTDCTISLPNVCVLKNTTSNKCSTDLTKSCTTDLECAVTQVCSVQKDKIKRNLKRLQDMNAIGEYLQDYNFNHGNTYPNLQSGTYLSGQTVSTWPSWSLLSNAVGGNIPADPINKLGFGGTCSSSTGQFCTDDAVCKVISPTETCILHDMVTGWSTADKRFSFACSNDSLAYRYTATSSGANYLVKFRLEDPGVVIDNFNSLIADYKIDLKHFDFANSNTTGICNQLNEISTISQGYCGDGKVNVSKGEECDPSGSVVWNTNDCNAAAITSSSPMSGKLCGKDCKWSTMSTSTKCGVLSKCGNGKVESGEYCDEGALNGKYNHCNLTCSGLAASCGNGKLEKDYEVCDVKMGYNGWCISGYGKNKTCSDDSDCHLALGNSLFSSVLGKCVLADENKQKYGLAAADSCAFDCQKTGPYCGDGIVQPEFGEECEGNQSCSLNGVSGVRLCSNQCRWKNDVATLYYNFNEPWFSNDNTVPKNNTYFANISSSTMVKPTDLMAHCDNTATGYCPTQNTAASKSFDGTEGVHFDALSNQYLKVNNNPSLDFNEITFATWLKIDSNIPNGYHTIVSKENSQNGDNGVPGDGRTYDHNRDFNFYIITMTTGTQHYINNLYISSRVFPDNYKTNDISQPIFGDNSVQVSIPSNEWHFVAVTVDAARNTNYYVDGVFVGAGAKNGNPNLKADHQYPIKIGVDDVPGNNFKGSLDEFQIYSRALSSFEIQDIYKNSKNICAIKPVVIADNTPTTPTGCGNAKIDANEACDNGAKNGVVCTSGYNKSCTYCSADCKNVITVNASGYCGDGIINGNEMCDVVVGNQGLPLIFSTVTTTGSNSLGLGTLAFKASEYNGYYVSDCTSEYNLSLNSSSAADYNAKNYDNLIYQTGTKSCINNCGGIANNCISCGLKVGGATVSGYVMNVLDPMSNNPLLASSTNNFYGTIDLMYSETGKSAVESKEKVAFNYYIPDKNKPDEKFNKFVLKAAPPVDGVVGSVAAINSDPVCSDSTKGRSYRLALNADWNSSHLIDFPVFGTTTPDKYNLLISPVINSNNLYSTAKHVRIVVSWVGSDSFNAGFVVPGGFNYSGGNATILEDNSSYTNLVTGADYYNIMGAPNAGVWYHGFGNQNTSNVKTFTVNTLIMDTSTYAFYVRSPGVPIKELKNSSKMKVEIYMPENDVNSRHFARPVKTYYLNQAIPSDNSAAAYWHVFNINRFKDINSISNLNDNISDINMIRSFIKMNYAP